MPAKTIEIQNIATGATATITGKNFDDACIKNGIIRSKWHEVKPVKEADKEPETD